MRGFLASLYYYPAGDRSRPIHLPGPKGSKSPEHFKMFPEGMTVKTRDLKHGDSKIEEEFGRLTMPDEDAVSAVLSLGTFVDDNDDFDVQPPRQTRLAGRAQTFPFHSQNVQVPLSQYVGSEHPDIQRPEHRFKHTERQFDQRESGSQGIQQSSFYVPRPQAS